MTARAPALGDVVLALSGVSKTFGGEHALRDVELDVRQGEVHALMGENGSGKSTLVKVLAGFHVPEPGSSACVAGQHIRLGGAGDAHAAGIRFVHQELGLVESMSAVENMGLSRGFDVRGGRIRWRAEHARARAAVSRLGYAFDVGVAVSRLSIAERTVVAIARALDEPAGVIRLLVLDEPTASLSGPEAARLLKVVEAVRDQGIGVILVSHHLDEVLGIADRVTVLRDGMRVGTFPAADIDRQRLVELMTGRELVEEDHGGDPVRRESPVLEVTGLKGEVLDGIDLAVFPGEVLGVAGITGSGREELALLLYGALPMRAGTLSLAGAGHRVPTPETAGRLGVGFVSGDRLVWGLIPTFSVLENMTISELDGIVVNGLLSRKRERAEVSRWIDRFGIRPATPRSNIMTLSGGNQQKVLMAKTMRTRPRLLLLDDPTRGVDVGAKAEIHRLIHEAARGGAGVLLCSSDTDELARSCHRTIVLRRGTVVRELTGSAMDADVLTQLAL